jgi:hypothetical protein
MNATLERPPPEQMTFELQVMCQYRYGGMVLREPQIVGERRGNEIDPRFLTLEIGQSRTLDADTQILRTG